MAGTAQPSEKSDGLVFHPMDQFIVEPLFGSGPIHWYTVTNVTLWMGLSVVALVQQVVVLSAHVRCCLFCMIDPACCITDPECVV